MRSRVRPAVPGIRAEVPACTSRMRKRTRTGWGCTGNEPRGRLPGHPTAPAALAGGGDQQRPWQRKPVWRQRARRRGGPPLGWPQFLLPMERAAATRPGPSPGAAENVSPSGAPVLPPWGQAVPSETRRHGPSSGGLWGGGRGAEATPKPDTHLGHGGASPGSAPSRGLDSQPQDRASLRSRAE